MQEPIDLPPPLSGILAETVVDLKLINKEPERRLAVFRLARIGNEWKLHSVDIFERR